MGVFDTHAHYDSGAFNQDRLEVLAGLPEQGVELIVNPGCDLPSSRKALELAHTFPFVYAAVGIHPSDCGDFEESQMGELEELARDEKVKAIGEIGLDYHWEDNPPKEHQKKVFALQMELAEKLGLPVVVHDREAHGDSMQMVREHPGVRGVFHCYSGSLEDAKALVKMGWMLSFTGVITYKNARRALEVLEWLPLDRVMIETDSPYLTPNLSAGSGTIPPRCGRWPSASVRSRASPQRKRPGSPWKTASDFSISHNIHNIIKKSRKALFYCSDDEKTISRGDFFALSFTNLQKAATCAWLFAKLEKVA